MRTRYAAGAVGELLERAMESVAVARRQDLGEAAREFDRMRGKLLVDRASGRRQRDQRLAHVGAIGAPRDQLAPFQDRDRSRHLGLMHVGVGADRLAVDPAELSERHQHPPFRNAEAVMPRIDPRQGLRHQGRNDLKLIGQELFEFQRRLVAHGCRPCDIVFDVAFPRFLSPHRSPMGLDVRVPPPAPTQGPEHSTSEDERVYGPVQRHAERSSRSRKTCKFLHYSGVCFKKF
jgi:hypothetical protein